MRLLLTIIGLYIITPVLAQPAGNTDHFAAGMKAIESKNYTQAIVHFKNAVAQKPQYGEAWYELGWCYNEQAKYEEAINALQQAKTWWKDAAKVYYESGYANDFGGKTAEAIKDYKKCIELSETYASAYRQLANIYFDIDKDYKTALSYYTAYIKYNEGKDITAKIWYRKGYTEIETNQYNEALISLQKAVGLDNKYASAYDEMGYVYYKQGKADEAIAAYTTSRQADTSGSAACSGLGDTYRYLKKNTDEALTWYKKGAQLNPKSQNCNYGAGWCYNEKGKYSDAIPYLKKTVAINNQYAAAYTELGYAYYALKRYDDAIAELDRSLKLSETATVYYYKGLCYVGKYQKLEAQAMYQKLIELKSADASNLLKRIDTM
jgi:tetratricopeptide (TPR) repeat protein